MWGAGGGSTPAANGGSGAFVFATLTGLNPFDRLRISVGGGGALGGAAGGAAQGAGGAGTPAGGASGGGYSMIELRRTGAAAFVPILLAAGGGGAGSSRAVSSTGGAGGVTDGYRAGVDQIISTECAPLCAPGVACSPAVALVQGGGGSSTLKMGGLGSWAGSNGTLRRGGNALTDCTVAASTASRAPAVRGSPAPSPSPLCVAPGGGGGGGWYGGGAGMGAGGGGGSSYVDVGIVSRCALQDNANEWVTLIGEQADPDFRASNALRHYDDTGFWNLPGDSDADAFYRQVDWYPDACFVQTGANGDQGRRFTGIVPAASTVGLGGAGGLPGGPGLVVIQLPQSAALPSVSATSLPTLSRAPRTPASTRSVTNNPTSTKTRRPKGL